jgi:hypothetical protein
MNDDEIRLLKSSVDKMIRIRFQDGEVLIAKILFVWDEYGDFTFDIISTNREEKYKKNQLSAAYTINLKDIVSVESI